MHTQLISPVIQISLSMTIPASIASLQPLRHVGLSVANADYNWIVVDEPQAVYFQVPTPEVRMLRGMETYRHQSLS